MNQHVIAYYRLVARNWRGSELAIWAGQQIAALTVQQAKVGRASKASLRRERSIIQGELARLSRGGWARATRDDYGPMEDRLAEIDATLAR